MRKPPAVAIAAGVSGLTTQVRLARPGWRVTVVAGSGRLGHEPRIRIVHHYRLGAPG